MHNFISKLKSVTRFTRGFVVAAIMLSVLLQGTPSLYAAVPVYMVNPKSDPGNVFVVNLDERSVETFMFDLFNTLAKREEDFTTSFELMKIEKAREDVNKLFQESIKELQDYGATIDSTFISSRDWTTIVASGPGSSTDPVLSTIKGSRIINNPADYLFNEPIAAGRIGAICYYLSVIADQRGLLSGNTIVKATFSDRYSTTAPIGSFNSDTNQSVNRLWSSLSMLLLSLDPGPTKRADFLENESIFLNKTAIDNPSTGATELQQRLNYCRGIMASFGLNTPQDIDSLIQIYRLNGLVLDNKQEEAVYNKLTEFPFLINKGPTYEQIRLAEQPINKLDGVAATALTIAQAVSQRLYKIKELSFVAGQGVRPQNLYVTYKDTASAPGGGAVDSAFLLNTEYVISPAVVLLQKMQSATQAEFDLAGQGFLALDPALASSSSASVASILGNYNVSSNAPAFGSTPPDPKTSVRGVCNNPPEDNPSIPSEPLCLLVDAWLKPNPSFRTSTLSPSDPFQQLPGGLPAPFEDENAYISLGNNYKITDYRKNNTPPPGQGDNIGSKINGVDYSVNDWFDRVLEMYEPSGNSNWFTLNDWDCYVTTWLNELQINKLLWGPSPTGPNFNTSCEHRIPPGGDGSY